MRLETCERGEIEPTQVYELFKEFEDRMVLECAGIMKAEQSLEDEDTTTLAVKDKDLDDPPDEGPILRWTTRCIFAPGGDAWHPKNRKVKLAVTLKELSLSKHAFHRLREIVGKRYHPGRDELTIISERFEQREENGKDCARTLYTLIEDAVKADKFVQETRVTYVKDGLRVNPAFMERLRAKTASVQASLTVTFFKGDLMQMICGYLEVYLLGTFLRKLLRIHITKFRMHIYKVQGLMNSNTMAPEFIYQQTQEEDDIDLGLSLCGSLQRETCHHPSGHCPSPNAYGQIMSWPKPGTYLKSSNLCGPLITEDEEDESQGAQSKERWSYVKVNMEGVLVGRKVCIVNHASYSSLTLELEDMFGKYSPSGLRLLEEEAGFCLFYQDRERIWRPVGGLPWREFMDCVKRLRIASKG